MLDHAGNQVGNQALGWIEWRWCLVTTPAPLRHPVHCGSNAGSPVLHLVCSEPFLELILVPTRHGLSRR